MKKLKVYPDTSVISHLYQVDAPEKMEEIKKLWEILKDKELYEVYISDIVKTEMGRCQEEKLAILIDYLYDMEYNVIEINENIVELAEKIIDFGILKKKIWMSISKIERVKKRLNYVSR